MANGISEQNFENFKVHIQQHKNFAADQSAAQQQPQAPVEAEGSPNLPGEAAGDDIAAQLGALEGIPEQGRPADIEGTGAF